MPAPKKAAKKAAKHAPEHEEPRHKEKKHDGKELKHKKLKDLRRTFEHLGRVETLLPQLAKPTRADVSNLVVLAQAVLKEGDVKSSADLVRAAEHLAFAALVRTESKAETLAAPVRQAVDEEFEHLSRKAVEHWEEKARRHPAVRDLYHSTIEGAKQALAQGAYLRAMELVRAAEALAHVEKHGDAKLTAGKQQLSFTK